MCGADMVISDVTPCLDCGADPKELDHWLTHRYARVAIFDNELLCDFCIVDMPSTDPAFWGFPANFDWEAAMWVNFRYLDQTPSLSKQYACTKCCNSLRRQEFIIRNARRNKVALPDAYWLPLPRSDGNDE
jgi:hypothetical protein